MDTKSKTSARSSIFQTLGQVILSGLVLVTLLTILFIDKYEGLYYAGSVYNTYDFRYEFGRRVHNIVEKELILKSPEHIEEMAQNDSSLDYQELLFRWYQIEANLDKSQTFRYYIHNLDTDEVYSNFSDLHDPEKYTTYPFRVEIDSRKIEAIQIKNGKVIYLDQYSQNVNSVLEAARELGNWEGRFTLLEPYAPTDIFYNYKQTYDGIQVFFDSKNQLYVGMLFVVIVGIFLFGILAFRRAKNPYGLETWMDMIPNDVKIVVMGFSVPIMMELIYYSLDFEPFFLPSNGGDQMLEVMMILATFLWVLLGIMATLSFIGDFGKRRFFKHTLLVGGIISLFNFGRQVNRAVSRNVVFRRRMLALIGLYGMANTFLGVLVYNEGGWLLIWLIFNIGALYLGYRMLRGLKSIMEQVENQGKIDLENVSSHLYDFGYNINHLQETVQTSVEQALKGEKLKTELITNVSHDLKTPLTAIINYVSLLKKMELEDEEAQNYIRVLEEKSFSLKALIEDVLEISKVSSGNVEVNLEALDIHQMLMQILGEYEEELAQMKLTVIHSDLNEPKMVKGDSAKLWRVIQNIVSNIIKYGMPNSRVFIIAKNEGQFVSLEFKNISKELLPVGNEDLKERFARGDLSRKEEGFGLGLAIANELMSIQGGKLDIVIDGDLFKAIIYIPNDKKPN